MDKNKRTLQLNLRLATRNETNPFIDKSVAEDLSERHIVRKFKSAFGNNSKAITQLVDVNTGDLMTTAFVQKIKVDDEQFTKVFTSHLQAFFNLTTVSIRVLSYIFSVMQPKNDMIIFDMKKCLNFIGYKSKPSVYRGLEELMKAEIIARGPADNLWFINPMVMFNGNRVNFIESYILNEEENKLIENQ